MFSKHPDALSYADENQSTRLIIEQLGRWYAIYRILLAGILLISFLLTSENLRTNYEDEKFYLYTAIGYLVISILQYVFVRFVKIEFFIHLILIFLVDIFALSCLIYALVSGANLQIGLIYLIMVFVASLLLNKTFSMMIMLIAIISVTYQGLIGGLTDLTHVRMVGNNGVLAFLFFAIYSAGRIAIEKFNILERTAIKKTVELSQLQQINQHILNHMDMGYVVINSKQEVILINPVACQLLSLAEFSVHENYPLLKICHYELFEFLTGEGKVIYDAVHTEPAQTIKQNQLQFHCQRSGYKMNIKLYALTTQQETLTLLSLQDMQEINQQVQQLKLAALGQLSASIAHEIRNPLSAIVQANELMHDDLDEDQQMLSNMIKKQATRIDQIVQSTLKMARQDTMYMEMLGVKDFLEKLMQEDLNDVQTQVEIECEPDTCLYFDKNQLRQVMINLVRNAIRHNADDRKVLIRTQKNQHDTYIDVIDFGDGVKKHEQSQLFKPFFTTAINGTGLGLYLSHSFCEANQAKLIYVDEPEQGACFRIIGLNCSLLGSQSQDVIQ